VRLFGIAEISQSPHVFEFLQWVTEFHQPHWLTTRDAHGQHDGILRAFRLAIGSPTLPTTIEALLKSIKPTTWHGSKVSGIDLGSDFVWIDDQPLRVEIDELQGRKLLSRLIVIDTNKEGRIYVREEQRGHLNFPNGAIDWTNASEHSDLLTGKVPGGSIDPDFTRVGSCSRKGAETEVLQKDPWCQRDYRDFTLITLGHVRLRWRSRVRQLSTTASSARWSIWMCQGTKNPISKGHYVARDAKAKALADLLQ
jgi:hypothetical protein